MKKILLAVAALVMPVQQAHAQAISISLDRYSELTTNAPAICEAARNAPGNMATNIEKYVTLNSVDERLFMLAMCRSYLSGVLSELKKRA